MPEKAKEGLGGGGATAAAAAAALAAATTAATASGASASRAGGSWSELGAPGTQPSGAKMAMPDGVQLLGGEAVFEEQADGSQALLLPEGAFLKLQLNASPWVLAEDGRLHQYTGAL